MEGHSFRFLHTGGFHLASTLFGIADPPEHLHDLLVEAPFRAAEGVFEAAVREEVDFLVLSGDILDPTSAGPSAVAFLQQRFAQLNARKIRVYWAASKSDLSGDLLFRLDLPANVRIFSCESPDTVAHCRGDRQVATLTGRSWNGQRPLRAAEFSREGQEGFQIAVLYARGDVQAHTRHGVHYWALGGSSSVAELFATGREMARCPGSPQGFCPQQAGPHSCTLVSVDGEGEIRIRALETDAVRWLEETFPVSEGAAVREVRQALRSHLERLASGQSRPLLVSLTLSGPGRFEGPLVRRRERNELLDWLRAELADRSPAVWPMALALEPPQRIPADWCDDDSILGDFLRAVQEQLEGGKEPLDLQGHVPQRPQWRDIAAALSFSDPGVVSASLRECAVIGLDLLRGDDAAVRNAAGYASRAENERVTA